MPEHNDIKSLLEEVRTLRRDLEVLKVNPAINQAIAKVVAASGVEGTYNVSYGVAVQSYNVLVMPPVDLGGEVEGEAEI